MIICPRCQQTIKESSMIFKKEKQPFILAICPNPSCGRIWRIPVKNIPKSLVEDLRVKINEN